MNTRRHLGIDLLLGDLDGTIKERNLPKTRSDLLDAIRGE
jgi:hypothetical protein